MRARIRHRLPLLPDDGGNDQPGRSGDQNQCLQPGVRLGNRRGRDLRRVEAPGMHADGDGEQKDGKGGAAELEAQRRPEKRQGEKEGIGGVRSQFPCAQAGQNHGDGGALEELSRGWARPFAPGVDGGDGERRRDQDAGGVPEPPDRPSRQERALADDRVDRASERSADDRGAQHADGEEGENLPQVGQPPDRGPHERREKQGCGGDRSGVGDNVAERPDERVEKPDRVGGQLAGSAGRDPPWPSPPRLGQQHGKNHAVRRPDGDLNARDHHHPAAEGSGQHVGGIEGGERRRADRPWMYTRYLRRFTVRYIAAQRIRC